MDVNPERVTGACGGALSTEVIKRAVEMTFAGIAGEVAEAIALAMDDPGIQDKFTASPLVWKTVRSGWVDLVNPNGFGFLSLLKTSAPSNAIYIDSSLVTCPWQSCDYRHLDAKSLFAETHSFHSVRCYEVKNAADKIRSALVIALAEVN